jgi:hypothetical protein
MKRFVWHLRAMVQWNLVSYNLVVPAKARSAYQDFFNVWKDADLDIPILKEAKAEYAKLQ